MKLWFALGAVGLLSAFVACDSSEDSRTPRGNGDDAGDESGGRTGSGGKAGSGGSVQSGGVSSSGGVTSSGGATPSSGGSPDIDASEPEPDASTDLDSGLVDAPPCNVAPDASLTAKLRVNADDYITVYFNGVFVAAPNTTWQTRKEYDVNVFLYPGKENVIAVEARNAFEQGGLDRGMIFELEYTVGDEHKFVNSDITWKVASPDDGGVAWTAIDYDDSGWANPISLGKSGIPPWTSVGFNTEAEWLWSYLPNGAPADKADNEVLHFRKSFYMGTDGTATGGPVRCK